MEKVIWVGCTSAGACGSCDWRYRGGFMGGEVLCFLATVELVSLLICCINLLNCAEGRGVLQDVLDSIQDYWGCT